MAASRLKSMVSMLHTPFEVVKKLFRGGPDTGEFGAEDSMFDVSTATQVLLSFLYFFS